MTITVTRSRAAVICFGAWGLQTMLHLVPRLRFLQVERRALGIDQELPDLDKLTAFATIMSGNVCLQAKESGAAATVDPPPLTIVRPDLNRYPTPSYVENRLLAMTGRINGNAGGTYAEQLGRGLLHRACEDKYVQPLVLARPSSALNQGATRANARANAFRSAVLWSEPVVRALVQEVIEPTRLDDVQILDPFVQTTIYVVASLAEPLSSAYVWPILAAMKAALGSRNVARIIGLFATGSFAKDNCQALEEANAHVALRELETLTGLGQWRGRLDGVEGVDVTTGDGTADAVTSEWKSLLRGIGGISWQNRVGEPIFHRIYLLDREKSSQSLASDAQHLAVMAGNAIEAFLVANGALLIETYLGPDSELGFASPYSLLGAANDYVPLRDYLYSAIDEEQKRIIRDCVLSEDEPPPHATLAELHADTTDAVTRLLRPHALRMLEPEPLQEREGRRWRRWQRNLVGRLWPNSPESTAPREDWLSPLRVRESFLLPENVLDEMRRSRTLWDWRAQFETRVDEADVQLEQSLIQQEFEQMWGLSRYGAQIRALEAELEPERPEAIAGSARRRRGGRENQAALERRIADLLERLESELRAVSEQTWAMRHHDDARVIPRAIFMALHQTVQDICGKPNGILTAHARIKAWRDEIKAILGRLSEAKRDLGDERTWQENLNLRIQRWERRFVAIANHTPHRSAIWVRAVLASGFVSFFLFDWLLYERSLRLSTWQTALAGIACAGVVAILGLGFEGLQGLRVRRLQRERIRLALEELSRRVNDLIVRNLNGVYRQFDDDLEHLNEQIEETVSYWRGRAQSRDEAPRSSSIPIRQAHTSQMLWKAVCDLVRAEADIEGKKSEDRFHQAWLRNGRDLRLWQQPGDSLGQQTRLALERGLNRGEAEAYLLRLEALRRVSNELATPPGNQFSANPRERADALESEIRTSWLRAGWCPFRQDSKARCSACRDSRGCTLAIHPTQSTEPETIDLREAPLDGAVLLLAAIIEDRAKAATAHLLPPRGVEQAKPEILRSLLQDYDIEAILQRTGANGSQELQRSRLMEFVETAVSRGKLSANADLNDPLTKDGMQTIGVDLAVTREGARSNLFPYLAQRQIQPLTSHDPISVSLVRTLHGVRLVDLTFTDRCRQEYWRLQENNQKSLEIHDTLAQNMRRVAYLLPTDEEQKVIALYDAIEYNPEI